MPKINAAGLAIEKSFEGCVLHAYADPGTGGAPWTIGYGHTGSCAAIGIDRAVEPGMIITLAQAEMLLAADNAAFESGVNDLVAEDLSSNQFSALVCFAYNVGLGALASSHLLWYINVTKGKTNPLVIVQLFGDWVYADGAILPGLVRRRMAEAHLFNTP